jgi:hypothetical protein
MVLTLIAPGARGDVPPLEDNAALQYWQAFSMISEGTKTAIDEADVAGPAPAMLADWIADDHDTRLAYLHAGAAMSRCDWGLDFSKGTELLLPHLNHARTLATLALLRAGHRFGRERWREGIDDVTATFELAKDVGDAPVMVSLLVRYGMEGMTMDVLARHIPAMDRAALDHLADVLEAHPREDSFKRVWPAAKTLYVDWASAQVGRIEREARGDEAKWAQGLGELRKYFGGGDDARLRAITQDIPSPERLRASFGAAKAMLEELEAAAELPTAEQDARVAAVDRRYRADPVAQLLVPDPTKSFLIRRRWQAHHALLDAAVAVAGHGEGALNEKRFADPFGDGAPFKYHKTEGGFELRSQLTCDGKPVALTVGKPTSPSNR